MKEKQKDKKNKTKTILLVVLIAILITLIILIVNKTCERCQYVPTTPEDSLIKINETTEEKSNNEIN